MVVSSSTRLRVRPREPQWSPQAPNLALQLTVDHIVDHMVPVDRGAPLLLPLGLLELPADGVPVTGTERGKSSAPGHHFFS